MVAFPKATVAKNAGEPITDRTEAAIAKVLSKHAAFKGVRFSVRAGLVHVRPIPLASLDLSRACSASEAAEAREAEGALTDNVAGGPAILPVGVTSSRVAFRARPRSAVSLDF